MTFSDMYKRFGEIAGCGYEFNLEVVPLDPEFPDKGEMLRVLSYASILSGKPDEDGVYKWSMRDVKLLGFAIPSNEDDFTGFVLNGRREDWALNEGLDQLEATGESMELVMSFDDFAQFLVGQPYKTGQQYLVDKAARVAHNDKNTKE